MRSVLGGEVAVLICCIACLLSWSSNDIRQRRISPFPGLIRQSGANPFGPSTLANTPFPELPGGQGEQGGGRRPVVPAGAWISPTERPPAPRARRRHYAA